MRRRVNRSLVIYGITLLIFAFPGSYISSTNGDTGSEEPLHWFQTDPLSIPVLETMRTIFRVLRAEGFNGLTDEETGDGEEPQNGEGVVFYEPTEDEHWIRHKFCQGIECIVIEKNKGTGTVFFRVPHFPDIKLECDSNGNCKVKTVAGNHGLCNIKKTGPKKVKFSCQFKPFPWSTPETAKGEYYINDDGEICFQLEGEAPECHGPDDVPLGNPLAKDAKRLLPDWWPLPDWLGSDPPPTCEDQDSECCSALEEVLKEAGEFPPTQILEILMVYTPDCGEIDPTEGDYGHEARD